MTAVPTRRTKKLRPPTNPLPVDTRTRLRQVAREILGEPRKIHMGAWVLSKKDLKNLGGKLQAPPCGSIACIGGWVVSLDARARGVRPRSSDIGGFATRILGLTDQQSGRLFFREQWPIKFYKQLIRSRPQSPEYAQAVVDRIKFFIETGGTDIVERV